MTRPDPAATTPPRRRGRARARWVAGTLLWGLAAYLLLQAALVLGLTVAMSVPDGPIVRQLAAAVESGTYGPDYVPDHMGGQLDRYTECIAVSQGLTPSSKQVGVWEKVLLTPRMTPCAPGVDNIRRLAAGGDDVNWGGYFRYWNGYALLTRPALAVFGLVGARVVSGVFLLVALILAWRSAHRRVGALAASGLLAPLVLSSNFLLAPWALSHAVALGVALLAFPLVAHWARSARSAALAAAVVGGVFVYSDLLTVPPMSWALATLGAVLAARYCGNGPRAAASWGLSAAVGWVGGYALTWATRWMLASIPNGFGNTWQKILEVGAFRIGGQYEEAVQTFPFASTWANVGQWLRVPTSWAFLLLTLAVLAWLPFSVRRTGRWLWPALIAAPALLVPVWFEFLRNHSQIHAFFTYLSVPVAIGIILLAAADTLQHRVGTDSRAQTSRATAGVDIGSGQHPRAQQPESAGSPGESPAGSVSHRPAIRARDGNQQ